MAPPKNASWQYFTIIKATSASASKLPIVRCKRCNIIFKFATIKKIKSHIRTCCPNKPDENDASTNPQLPSTSKAESRNPTNASKTLVNPITLSNALKAIKCGGKISDVSTKYKIPVSYLFLQITRLRLNDKSSVKSKIPSSSHAPKKKATIKLNEEVKNLFIISDELSSKKVRQSTGKMVISKRYFKAIMMCLQGEPINQAYRKCGVNYKTLWAKVRRVRILQAGMKKANMATGEGSSQSQDVSSDDDSRRSSTDDITSSSISQNDQPLISEPPSTQIDGDDEFASHSSSSAIKPETSKSFSYIKIVNHLKQEGVLSISPEMLNALQDLDTGMGISEAAIANGVCGEILESFSSKLRAFSRSRAYALKHRGFNIKSLVVKYTNEQISKMGCFRKNLIMVWRSRMKTRPYSVSNLAQSVLAVVKGKSFVEAARKYKIPLRSLQKATPRIGLNDINYARSIFVTKSPSNKNESNLTSSQKPKSGDLTGQEDIVAHHDSKQEIQHQNDQSLVLPKPQSSTQMSNSLLKSGLPTSFSYVKILIHLEERDVLYVSPAMFDSLKDIDAGMEISEAAISNKVDCGILDSLCSRLRQFSRTKTYRLGKRISNTQLFVVNYTNDQVTEMDDFPRNLIVAHAERICNYTVIDLATAITESLKEKQAIEHARKYGIPYTTLLRAIARIGLFINDRLYKARKKLEAVEPIDEPEDSTSQILSDSCIESDSTTEPMSCTEKKPLCRFCHQPNHREEEIGKLHSLGNINAHYYCLLFSSALEQNGNDNEGILGFLVDDIKKELRRGIKLKCNYCGKNGATIGCTNKQCRKTYHFPCGLDKFVQYVFCDNFSNYCEDHRKLQSVKLIGKQMECSICTGTIQVDPRYHIRPPCCNRSSWFHRLCLQKLALSAGYFFKCPLCNDKDLFTKEMLKEGVFVPERDASWELEPGAYEELLERPLFCGAKKCLCPKGRKADSDEGKWELIFCRDCGSTAIHSACRRYGKGGSIYTCLSCSEILKGIQGSSKQSKGIKRKRSSSISISNAEKCRKLEDGTSIASSSTITAPLSSSPANSVLELKLCSTINPKTVVASRRSNSGSLSDMFEFAINLPSKLEKRKLSLKSIESLCLKYASYKIVLTDRLISLFVGCLLEYEQMFFLYKLFILLFYLRDQPPKRTRRLSYKYKEELINHLNKHLPCMQSLTDSFQYSFSEDPHLDSEKPSSLEVLPTISEGTIENDAKIEQKDSSVRYCSQISDRVLRHKIKDCRVVLSKKLDGSVASDSKMTTNKPIVSPISHSKSDDTKIVLNDSLSDSENMPPLILEESTDENSNVLTEASDRVPSPPKGRDGGRKRKRIPLGERNNASSCSSEGESPIKSPQMPQSQKKWRYKVHDTHKYIQQSIASFFILTDKK